VALHSNTGPDGSVSTETWHSNPESSWLSPADIRRVQRLCISVLVDSGSEINSTCCGVISVS